ncbi:hypothetical protein RF11_08059 [Thelohanellus kitauei]|uniref:Uncharacterized protein n=1 Tax=Thelohanellus kitauei TaxID=669202 RepID=A0A0C2MGR3_THEKT|nr:hypothetical protein RF11_08059 [Thelohanellus kitauei]
MDASSGVSSGIEEIRPEFLTKAYDVNKWLFLFEELAVANKWNEARQAAVLPVFLRDDALEAYMESPLHTESPSPSKLKKLKTLLRNFRTTNDTISSAFVRFENARLAPGEDIKDFAKKLSQSIRTARPNLSEEDRNFFVLQKLLASLPKQTSSILRVLPDLKLDDTINKARQLMMDDESTNSVASIEPTNEKEVPNRHDDIEALRSELDELKTKSSNVLNVACEAIVLKNVEARHCAMSAMQEVTFPGYAQEIKTVELLITRINLIVVTTS